MTPFMLSMMILINVGIISMVLKIELLDVYHTMWYVDLYMKELEEFEEMKRKRDDGNISVKNTWTSLKHS